ncbi:unnamed protein product [Caenorhabditis sp. 36 PRJEB53466]|nr:unnamed protein product [Caenorhabditis sp. 36 PRJEB53466]
MSIVFHIVAVVSMFTISILGLTMNLYLFRKFSSKRGKASGFLKLCLVKTVPNSIVCASFLFWVVPLSLVQPDYENVPRIVNVFVGQVAGFGAYVTGPLLQFFMSCNRFAALYFATRRLRVNDLPITAIAVLFAFGIALIYTALGFRPMCGFVFYPSSFTWDKENSECASGMSALIFYTVVAVASCTNSLNVATAVRLSVDKVGGMSQSDTHRRRRKLILMFVQSVIQDCLHVIDLVNSIFIFKLSDAVWFQFIFLSVSFLMIHALDGSTFRMLQLGLFPLLAVISMLLTSFIGLLVGVWIFQKFVRKVCATDFSDFHKFCMVKTVPDMFVCAAFLFWVAPVTALSLTYSRVPYLPNVLIGQIASGGAYILGASIQMCMAVNRFFVLYFPFRQHSANRSYLTFGAIAICVGLAITYTLLGLRKLCAYVYDPEMFSWRVEESECADQMTTLIFWSIIVLALTSNTFNVATGMKFLCTQTSGIRQQEVLRRRKKRLWLFVQCVVQDCLHLTDLVNSIFIYQLSEETWFRYIFLCYSFLAIHATDGIVMFYFNPEVQPVWFRRFTNRNLLRTGAAVIVSSHNSAPRSLSKL